MHHTTPAQQQQVDAIVGCILGTAVGDSAGLCAEGLTRQRQVRLFPHLDGPCLLGNCGMVSDDTEHTLMVALALVAADGDVDRFLPIFADHLRWWLLGIPAGIGLATLRALLKLCCGVAPDHSGVFSAGNGPAMRSAVIGVWADDLETMRTFVRASTRITHTDPKAEYGAQAVALAAHMASRIGEDASPHAYLQQLHALLGDEGEELLALIRKAIASVEAGEETTTFCDTLGLMHGISGYVYHTVPAVLHAWFCHPDDFAAGVQAIIRCGGDTDTTAAILGAIIGARVGKAGIPADWLSRLWEWPRTTAWMEALGRRLAGDTSVRISPVPFLFVLPRNLLFLLAVLGHGFRRLLPPYYFSPRRRKGAER